MRIRPLFMHQSIQIHYVFGLYVCAYVRTCASCTNIWALEWSVTNMEKISMHKTGVDAKQVGECLCTHARTDRQPKNITSLDGRMHK